MDAFPLEWETRVPPVADMRTAEEATERPPTFACAGGIVNVPFFVARMTYEMVMEEELLVCPFTIWKLDWEEVLGP